ncbi:MAG: succinylglutamate desuccinylase/aspartoacylase family protein [Verrucomicrobia bacterium]|nr:succinylglutamate desuccinylase/aspartoacylase family protein [Verrucomicrobiota bacterium]
MKTTRRDFLRLTGMAGIGMVCANGIIAHASSADKKGKRNKVTVDHAVATLQDGSALATPFWRIECGRDGPSLVLIAAQHGNEVIGTEVARRFQEVCAAHLVAGSVWLVPVANLLAVRSRRHSYGLGPEQNNRIHPTKEHNMQRTWPGNPRGNDTERVAHALDQAVVRHGSHLLDMHCWQHVNAAETLALDDHPASLALGQVTTTRFISLRPSAVPPSGPIMVAQLMRRRAGASLVIELSGQFSMPERQVQIGLSSMVNLAKLLGMIAGKPESIPGPRVVRTKANSHEVRAPCSGMFVPAAHTDRSVGLAPEDRVEQGQPLGHIIREKDLVAVPIVAPVTGYLWQYGLCHWSLCDASLPALHPYTEEREVIATVVTA